MADPVLVSVVVTTYNSERFVGRLLDSVYGQSALRVGGEDGGPMARVEVIVADDGSTDGTLEIVSGYPGVRVLCSDCNSGGPNAGRNRGLDAASGDAIVIADHDDEWHADRLLMQIPHLCDAPIVSCGYEICDATSGRRVVRTRGGGGALCWPSGVTFSHMLSRAKGKECQIYYIGGILYSGSLRDVRFEEYFGVCDSDWLLRLFDGRASVEVSGVLFYRHVHGDNFSLDNRYRALDYYYLGLVLDGYYDRYPHLVERGLSRLSGSRARYFYLSAGNPDLAGGKAEKRQRMRRSRFYFRRTRFSLKVLLYYVTSYVGSGWVRRRFHIFG